MKTIVCAWLSCPVKEFGGRMAVKESLSNTKQKLLIARQHNTVCPLAGSDEENHVRNSCNGVVRVGSDKPPDYA